MKIPRIIASNLAGTGHYSKFSETTLGLAPPCSKVRSIRVLRLRDTLPLSPSLTPFSLLPQYGCLPPR